MARHMKPINRGPASAQGYGEASSADEKRSFSKAVVPDTVEDHR